MAWLCPAAVVDVVVVDDVVVVRDGAGRWHAPPALTSLCSADVHSTGGGGGGGAPTAAEAA